MGDFFLQATIYLSAAVIMVPLAKRFGLGSVLGYLIAGVLIGPILGLVGNEAQELQHFAEFGVVMMLFLVGLELEPKALWGMRDKLIGLGGLQVSVTTLAIMSFFILLGMHWAFALAIGLSFALSSTAIVVQTLNEKGSMASAGGRSSFSVLLTQDIAVIPMLAILPLLAINGIHNSSGGGHGDDHGAGHDGGHGGGAFFPFLDDLPGWGTTLVTLGAIALVLVIGLYLTRPLFQFIARSRLREMFTATALFLVIGIALIMTIVGLSPALGTFLAGVVLANSEFRHELESDIEPFKGLLLGLFFITVGAGINFDLLFGQFATIMGMTLGVMLIKAAVLYGLAIIFGLKERDRLLFTLGLAQAGEFGFVMLSSAVSNDVIPRALSDQMLLIVAISMILTPILFILVDQLSKRFAQSETRREDDTIDEQGAVIIVGMGRFGQIVNRVALACGLKTTVIDHHIEQVENMRRFGVKAYFGDPTRPDLLEAAGISKAQVLVVSIDDQKAATQLVKSVRDTYPDLRIIARAYDREHCYHLYSAGANDIIRETFDSSVRAARSMLEAFGWSQFDIENASESFVKFDRSALAELARHWDPNIPSAENKAYIERAREMMREFDNTFLDNLSSRVEENAIDSELSQSLEKE